MAAGVATATCQRTSPAPPQPAPKSSQVTQSQADARAPAHAPVETLAGCWSDAGRGPAAQRLARLKQACVAGQTQLREVPLQPDRALEVPLPAGIHCLRALLASVDTADDPTLTLRAEDGRSVADGITSNVGVVPPGGPLCVRGPTHISVLLQGKSPALLSLHAIPQEPAPDAASQ
jgi:hypothetical protein